MRIVYLNPRASIGGPLRSDTIWGMLCWGIRNIYSEKELQSFLESYSLGEKSALKVSSAFPFIRENGSRTLYFPKPMMEPFDWNSYFEGKNKDEKVEAVTYLKKLKKVDLISRDTFFAFLKGEITEVSFFEKRELWDSSVKSRFRNQDVVHNTIDRISNTTVEGALYTKEEIFIKDGGLFFLLDGDEKYVQMAEAALRFYSHMGFGGDASIGRNSFRIEFEDFEFPEVRDANCFVTLSLYNPAEDELRHFKLNSDYSWYETEVRKGKAGGQFLKVNDFWKASTMMFKEGSVFSSMGRKHYGRNIAVKEKNAEIDHQVLQFGVAFNLPIRVNGKP
jgi:CRISPR-associated protein Csm4